MCGWERDLRGHPLANGQSMLPLRDWTPELWEGSQRHGVGLQGASGSVLDQRTRTAEPLPPVRFSESVLEGVASLSPGSACLSGS